MIRGFPQTIQPLCTHLNDRLLTKSALSFHSLLPSRPSSIVALVGLRYRQPFQFYDPQRVGRRAGAERVIEFQRTGGDGFLKVRVRELGNRLVEVCEFEVMRRDEAQPVATGAFQ